MPDQIMLQLILFAVSTAYQISQTNKMKREADKRKGFAVTISGEAASIPVVYGKAVLGGIETKHKVTSSYISATDISDKTFDQGFSNSTRPGTKNEYLHVQYALATEGIEGVQWVKVNGSHYNNTIEKFKHLIRTFNTGGTADPIATANIGEANNKFTDTSWASATFQLNRDDYNYNGVPQMEFLVKGRKVRWIQESNGVYTLSTEYVYSNNPALCLLDYLTNIKFGRGLTVDEIDLESFYHAAEICDTIVATDRITAGKVNGQKKLRIAAGVSSLPPDLEKRTYENEIWKTTDTGQYWYWDKTTWVGTTYDTTRPIPLYECNITLDTSERIRDNVERIMSTMGLAELTWSSEGKYKLLLEYPDTLTATRALVNSNHHFTDDDIIRDQINMSWPEASSRLNRATVSFLNEHEDFKEDSISWPPINSSIHNQYLTEDNNQPFESELNLEGVTDPYHALAAAEQAVRKSRTIFTLDLTVSKKGLNLEPGDFINVTSELANISNEVFRVESIEVNADFTVKLSCYKYDHNVLAWNVDDDIAYVEKPVFDFTLSPPTNLQFNNTASILGTASGKLSWTAADDISAIEYLVEISSDDGSTWETLGTTRALTFDVVGLVTGVYSFRVRSRSPNGTLSTSITIEDETIQLKTVGQVAIVYADTADELTNTQSYTLGSNKFVAYYPYTSDLPTLPIRSGITFAEFVGDNSYVHLRYSNDNGTTFTGNFGTAVGDYLGTLTNNIETASTDPADYTWSLIKGGVGPTGNRGAGWWRYEDSVNASTYYGTSTVDQARVDAAFSTAVNLDIIEGDRLIISCTDEAVAYLQNSTGNWVYQDEFLDGNLLVSGTITGNKIQAGTISGDRISASTSITSPTINGGIIEGGIIRGAVIEAGVLVSLVNAFPINQETDISLFADSAERSRAFVIASDVENGAVKVFTTTHSESYLFSNGLSNVRIPESELPYNVNQSIPSIASSYDADLLKRNWTNYVYYEGKVSWRTQPKTKRSDSSAVFLTTVLPSITVEIVSGSTVVEDLTLASKTLEMHVLKGRSHFSNEDFDLSGNSGSRLEKLQLYRKGNFYGNSQNDNIAGKNHNVYGSFENVSFGFKGFIDLRGDEYVRVSYGPGSSEHGTVIGSAFDMTTRSIALPTDFNVTDDFYYTSASQSETADTTPDTIEQQGDADQVLVSIDALQNSGFTYDPVLNKLSPAPIQTSNLIGGIDGEIIDIDNIKAEAITSGVLNGMYLEHGDIVIGDDSESDPITSQVDYIEEVISSSSGSGYLIRGGNVPTLAIGNFETLENPPDYAAGEDYLQTDVVYFGGNFYQALVNITASAENPDVSSSWRSIERNNNPNYLFYTPSSGLVVGGSITAGSIRGGNLKDTSNKANTDTTEGGYIDLDAGTFLFGQAKSDGEFIKWDGNALNISGSAISAANLEGTLTGNVTGNVSGSAGDVLLNATDNGTSVEVTAGATNANLTITSGTGISVNAVPTENNDTITISSNIDNQSVSGSGNVTVNQVGNTFTVSANDSIGNLNSITSDNTLISFDNANNVVTFNGNTPGSGNLRNSNVTLGALASSNITLGNLASANTVSYTNEVNDKPTLGNLASSNITLGNLATSNTVLGNFATLNDLNSINGNAANASNVRVDSTVADEDLLITGVDSQTDVERIEASSNIKMNPANSSITANLVGNVTGNVSGNAASAVNATSATNAVSATNAGNADNITSQGDLATANSVDYDNQVNSKPTLGSLASSNATLGALATVNAVSYTNQVNAKPTLGNLASSNATLGALATVDSVNYTNEVNDKPTLGNLASSNVTLGNLATSSVTLGNLASSNATIPTVNVNGVDTNEFNLVSGVVQHATTSPSDLGDNTNNNTFVFKAIDFSDGGHVTGVRAVEIDSAGSAIEIVEDAVNSVFEQNIRAGSVNAREMTTTELNAAEAIIGSAQIDSLVAASAQITNLNAGDITATNIDTNVLNSQQTVVGRSLQVGNLLPSANAVPASGSGMFVIGADDAGTTGTTSGDFSLGSTNKYIAWDTSEGNLTIQGDIKSAAFNRSEVLTEANTVNNISTLLTVGTSNGANLGRTNDNNTTLNFDNSGVVSGTTSSQVGWREPNSSTTVVFGTADAEDFAHKSFHVSSQSNAGLTNFRNAIKNAQHGLFKIATSVNDFAEWNIVSVSNFSNYITLGNVNEQNNNIDLDSSLLLNSSSTGAGISIRHARVQEGYQIRADGKAEFGAESSFGGNIVLGDLVVSGSLQAAQGSGAMLTSEGDVYLGTANAYISVDATNDTMTLGAAPSSNERVLQTTFNLNTVGTSNNRFIQGINTNSPSDYTSANIGNVARILCEPNATDANSITLGNIDVAGDISDTYLTFIAEGATAVNAFPNLVSAGGYFHVGNISNTNVMVSVNEIVGRTYANRKYTDVTFNNPVNVTGINENSIVEITVRTGALTSATTPHPNYNVITDPNFGLNQFSFVTTESRTSSEGWILSNSGGATAFGEDSIFSGTVRGGDLLLKADGTPKSGNSGYFGSPDGSIVIGSANEYISFSPNNGLTIVNP